jgi:low affinity Fe/Cu permease
LVHSFVIDAVTCFVWCQFPGPPIKEWQSKKPFLRNQSLSQLLKRYQNFISQDRVAMSQGTEFNRSPQASMADRDASPEAKQKETSTNLENGFALFAAQVSKWAGRPVVFFAAMAVVILWAVTGPYFDYSPQWQNFIHTVVAISTFLMVFAVKNSQNREDLAVQIKLDELIRASDGAKNNMINLESFSHQELEALKQQFEKVGHNARNSNSSSPNEESL